MIFILYMRKSLVDALVQAVFVQVRQNLEFGGLAKGWMHMQAKKGCGKVRIWKERGKIRLCGRNLG